MNRTLLSGAAIFAMAPLGARLRFSDGTPEPPARHVNKHRAWARRNGGGRLVMVEPAGKWPGATDGLKVHVGTYGAGGIIMMQTYCTFSAAGDLQWEILEQPQPGHVLLINEFQGRRELQEVAADEEAAQAAIHARHRHSSTIVTEIVQPRPTVFRDPAAAAETEGWYRRLGEDLRGPFKNDVDAALALAA